MGILVLCIMILAEVGLGVFTVLKQRNKKQWLRNRCLADIIELAAYFILMLLPKIDFGFRFKCFFLILVIRVIVSAIAYFIKKRKAQGMKKISGMVVSIVVSIIILGMSLVPAFIFTGYEGKETTGEHSVASAQVILVDNSREEPFEADGSKREVPVHFYYPADADGTEKYPVVLFSHGAFGYYQSNTSTYMELASNGYVVLSLDHPYHSFFTSDTTGATITVNPKFINDAMYINEDTTSEEEIYELSSTWSKLRIADVNFVLDTVKEAVTEKNISDAWFLGETDDTVITNILNMAKCDKMGVMGHSLGGDAAVGVGRTRNDIGAVIDLDGTMISEQLGYENGSYIMNEEPYPIPLLSIDNESHYVDGQKYGSYYVNNVVIDNAMEGYHTYFVGAAHMNFTDLPLFAPVLAKKLGMGTIDKEKCIDMTNQIVLQFMDYFLKDKGELNIQEKYE